MAAVNLLGIARQAIDWGLAMTNLQVLVIFNVAVIALLALDLAVFHAALGALAGSGELVSRYPRRAHRCRLRNWPAFFYILLNEFAYAPTRLPTHD